MDPVLVLKFLPRPLSPTGESQARGAVPSLPLLFAVCAPKGLWFGFYLPTDRERGAFLLMATWALFCWGS